MTYGLKMIKCGLVAALIGLKLTCTSGAKYDTNRKIISLDRGDIVKRRTPSYDPPIEYRVTHRKNGSNVYHLRNDFLDLSPALNLKKLVFVKSAKDFKKDEKLQSKLDSATPSIEYIAEFMGAYYPPSNLGKEGDIVIYQNRNEHGELVGEPMLGSVTRFVNVSKTRVQRTINTKSGLHYIMGPAWSVFVKEWKRNGKIITCKINGHVLNRNHSIDPKILAVVPATPTFRSLKRRTFSDTEYKKVLKQLTAKLRQEHKHNFNTHDFKGDADRERAKREASDDKHDIELKKLLDKIRNSKSTSTTPTGSSSNMSIRSGTSDDVDTDREKAKATSAYSRFQAVNIRREHAIY